jgi:hypothetical protein
MNETANGQVTPRANWLQIAALVLLALAIASVCLLSGVTSHRTPGFWLVTIRVANFRLEVFSDKLSGTGVLGTLEIHAGYDAVIARQLGIVYRNGKWEVLK